MDELKIKEMLYKELKNRVILEDIVYSIGKLSSVSDYEIFNACFYPTKLDQSLIKDGYFKTKCPLKKECEGDESFVISMQKKVFYCFSCNGTGDVLSFLSKILDVSMHTVLMTIQDKESIEEENFEILKIVKNHFEDEEKNIPE